MDQMNQFNQSDFQQQYRPMTLGDWLITLLIQAIPLVGFIMLFVWAFGGDTHPSKKTWAQASLLFALIMLVLVIIFFAAMWSFFMSFFSGYNMNYSS
ncbi:Hypothetical protein IALB_2947 [Ignavibacterium album JCM 16511]|uniref:Uncharacterized protein n=1 Tax=Ignavibacterium album (strain DSM 19864 / JCM 16511 / NBRC 101810 / Mat9-16) TaxID=945713 RepID=I0ANU3_IGNAJ|nr:hypothetical protein [Ignavibacterium album]AFH50650.1 Hypothetical protein IALB_2947 [Ignavibacterium album JCM 16511]